MACSGCSALPGVNPNQKDIYIYKIVNYFKYTCMLQLKLYNTITEYLFLLIFGRFERSNLHCNVYVFLYCKRKTVIWQAGKKYKHYYLLSLKKYIAKNKHTLFCETFFFINEKPIQTMQWKKKIGYPPPTTLVISFLNGP